MTTPNVTINLRSSSNRVNPQDLSAIGCVFAYCIKFVVGYCRFA